MDADREPPACEDCEAEDWPAGLLEEAGEDAGLADALVEEEDDVEDEDDGDDCDAELEDDELEGNDGIGIDEDCCCVCIVWQAVNNTVSKITIQPDRYWTGFIAFVILYQSFEMINLILTPAVATG